MRKSTFALALSLLVAIVWLGLQGNQPRAADDAKPQRQKWEYLLDRVDSQFIKADYLNKKGDQGWEFCGLAGGSVEWSCVFKRPKQ